VSCAGAGTVLATLDRDRYEVIPVGILPDGRWILARDEPERLAIRGGKLPTVADVADPLPLALTSGPPEGASRGADPPEGARPEQALPEAASLAAGTQQGADHEGRGAPAGTAEVVTAAQAQVAVASVSSALTGVDVVLPILHGPFGEDGTIQGLLEMAGVPYVGAGVLASAVSMDKEYMKLIFAARSLPICPYVVVRDRDWQPGTAAAAAAPASAERKRVLDAIAELGFPVFVKPARGGSSIGTSRAGDRAALAGSIEAARQYDPKVIVEKAIEGAEIECSVLEGLDGAPPDVSMPGQLIIHGSEGFYDFETKYLDPAGSMAIPPPIPAEDIEEIRRMAGAAFEAVSCEGFARVDFFYTAEGRILLNEINTIPGMTASSYFPKMWEASGLPMPQLLDRMIATALARRPGPR
jgi:D-alanine-D-alanine ligase